MRCLLSLACGLTCWLCPVPVLGQAGQIFANFQTGAPTNSFTYGSATVVNGALQLTPPLTYQMGSWIINDFNASQPVSRFVAEFDALVDGGTAADGFSFSFASDLPDGPFGEEGAGTGLTVSFDTYDNGGGEAPAIGVTVSGRVLTNHLTEVRTGTTPIPVRIELFPDGTLDVDYAGNTIFSRLPTPYEPVPGRFGFGARTGASTDVHQIDNASIRLFRTLGPPVIVLQPVNQTVIEQRPFAFRVGTDGSAPQFFQWQHNGAPIIGATNPIYRAIATLGSGGSFRCQILNGQGSVFSAPALLTVLPDTVPPAVDEVSGDPSFRRARVRFSERVSAASATDAAHYSISGLAVLEASLQADERTVLLRTSGQTPAAPYELQVNGIQDLAATPNTINPNTPAYFTAWLIHNGLVQVSIYRDLPAGNAVHLLTQSPKFPGQPDLVFLTNNFSSLRNYADQYGAWIAGFFTLPSVPFTGPTTFYAAGDDEFAVQLSPDDDPLNAVRIIDGLVCCQPLSAHPSPPQPLLAGQRRYLEGFVKEGAGEDFFEVAVRIGVSNGVPTEPIPSRYLSTAANPDKAGTLTITHHPSSTVGTIGHPTTFSVQAVNSLGRPPFIQWQSGRDGMFTNIAGAIGSTFHSPPLVQSDGGKSFRAMVQVPGRIATSSPALLLVVPDRTPPHLVSVASVNSLRANLRFSERLDPASANSGGNYEVAGATVIGASLQPDGQSVELILAEPVQFLTVTVSNVRDVAGNPVAPNSTVQGPVWAQDVTLGTEIGGAFTTQAGEVEVVAGGSDIWGAADEFHFVYQTRTGDFDVEVKVEQLEPAGYWSKAGLMVRNELAANGPTLQAYTTPAAPEGAGVYEAGYRNEFDGETFNWAFDQPLTPLPNAWVRLRRISDNFTAFHSADGQSWTPYASLSGEEIPGVFNETVFLGLATTAQSPTGSTRARYSRFGFLVHPSIVAHPQSQTLQEGDTIVLTTTAGGTQPIRYQWRLNGVNIPGATNSAFLIFESTVKDGGSYTVLVVGPNGVAESQPATVIVNAQQFPFSDAFVNAPLLEGETGAVNGDNFGATLELNEPSHTDRTGGSSVWASWQAPFSGPVTFSTRGSAFDTLLAVYEGGDLATLTRVADDDDRGGFGTSQVLFNAQVGRLYHVAIDGLGGAEGQLALCWELQVGPPAPIILTQPRNHVVQLGDSVSFFIEVENASRIEWLLNGVVDPNFQGTGVFIAEVGLADVGLYVARVYGPDGERFIDSRPAWIEIGAMPESISYDKFERLFEPPKQGGQGGSNPGVGVPVTAGSTSSQVLNNHNSTTQAGEPNHCGRLTGSTRWFGPLFTTANGLMFEVDTRGSAINTILASYVGNDLLTISNVDCAVGPGAESTLRFPAMPGTLYSIAVDGTNGVTGQILLNYKLGVEPSWIMTPTDRLVMPGEAVEFVAEARGTPDPSYQWHTNGVAIPGATSPTFRVDSVEPGHAGVYTVVASNLMGTASAQATLEVGTSFAFQFQEILTNGVRAIMVIGPTNALAAQPYMIEASFDFNRWDPIWTNGTPEVRTNFIDADHLFFPYRFYRAVPAAP